MLQYPNTLYNRVLLHLTFNDSISVNKFDELSAIISKCDSDLSDITKYDISKLVEHIEDADLITDIRNTIK